MVRVHLQPAYVLHRRPYSDTSAVVELFTADHGRVPAMARGVQRPKSSWRGSLQAFSAVSVSWSGKEDFPTLTDVDRAGQHRIALSGDALLCGLYLNELLMRLLARNDPHPDLFEYYHHTLGALAGEGTRSRALRLFEKTLLEQLGYGLMLDHEADTGASIDPAALYRYQPEHGPVRTADRAPGSRVHGRTLQSLSRGDLSDRASLAESKQLMRTVLAHYLGDKPLNTRALFRGR